MPYAEIPHFPESTAPGHAGRLVMGYLGGRTVALLSGRAHLYEGYSETQVVFAARLMHMLGASTLIVTNAAGGVNLDFHPGMLMVIDDHINLTGRSPLLGMNDPRLGTRFPDMSYVYDPELRSLALMTGAELNIPMSEGVYLGLLGPSYETPAEIRMARLLGGDAVGMSTVQEAIAAVHIGMKVLGISCITNMAAGMRPQRLSEQEVIDTANRVRNEFAALILGVLSRLPESS